MKYHVIKSCTIIKNIFVIMVVIICVKGEKCNSSTVNLTDAKVYMSSQFESNNGSLAIDGKVETYVHTNCINGYRFATCTGLMNTTLDGGFHWILLELSEEIIFWSLRLVLRRYSQFSKRRMENIEIRTATNLKRMVSKNQRHLNWDGFNYCGVTANNISTMENITVTCNNRTTKYVALRRKQEEATDKRCCLNFAEMYVYGLPKTCQDTQDSFVIIGGSVLVGAIGICLFIFGVIIYKCKLKLLRNKKEVTKSCKTLDRSNTTTEIVTTSNEEVIYLTVNLKEDNQVNASNVEHVQSKIMEDVCEYEEVIQ